MQIISYIFSIAGLLSMIIASLLKGKSMREILVFVFLGNAFVATSYLFSNTPNGAISCYIGAVQTIINYFFGSRNKKLPVWLIALYAASFIIFNLIVGVGYLKYVAIIACLTFIMGIGQKSGKNYRTWSIINLALWSLYDILSHSYAPLVTHAIQIFSNITGMVIHDLKKKDA